VKLPSSLAPTILWSYPGCSSQPSESKTHAAMAIAAGVGATTLFVAHKSPQNRFIGSMWSCVIEPKFRINLAGSLPCYIYGNAF
jgi:hypothetical protein